MFNIALKILMQIALVFTISCAAPAAIATWTVIAILTAIATQAAIATRTVAATRVPLAWFPNKPAAHQASTSRSCRLDPVHGD